MDELFQKYEPPERSLIMIKPDGVQRGLVGEIIQRFEKKGLKLVNIKMIWASENIMKLHSTHLKEESFFDSYIKYMISGPVIVMVWNGFNAIKVGRLMIGATFPQNCAPKMIRGDYSLFVRRSIIHGSDSVESANKEIRLWFGDDSSGLL